MKKRILYPIIILAIMLCTMTSCRQDVVSFEDKYTIYTVDGQWYIDVATEEKRVNSNDLFYSGIDFLSVSEMKQMIMNGELSEINLEVINGMFPRDQEGRIKFHNLDDIYIPTSSQGMKTDYMHFTLDGTYEVGFSSGEFSEKFERLTEQEYAERCENYEDYYMNTFDDCVKAYEQETNTFVYSYSNAPSAFEIRVYTVEDRDKEFLVRKRYRFDLSDDGKVISETKELSGWNIYGNIRGVKFEMSSTGPRRIPTEEWLLQLDVEKYDVVPGYISPKEWLIISAVAVLLAAGAVIVILIRRRRKKTVQANP